MLGQLLRSLGSSRRDRLVTDRLAEGLRLQKGGDLDGAIASYRAALEIAPDHVDALCLAGNALKLKGDRAGAAAMLRSAAGHAPDRAHVLLLLAGVLKIPEERTEGIAVLRQALALQGDAPELQLNYKLATWLQDAGFAEEARSHYDKAYQLTGDDAMNVRRLMVVPPIPRSSAQIQAVRTALVRDAERLLERELHIASPVTAIEHTDFYLAYHGFGDRSTRELLGRLWLHAYPDLDYVSPDIEERCAARAGKIRIGVISKFLRAHTIGRLMQGFLTRLDRERFELVVFVWGESEDDVGAAIRGSADEVVVLGEGLADNRRRIAERRVDVLFYCDVGMEPATYFLAFARLAPVQCVTWGHPVTTGLPYIDYFVSSELIEGEGAPSHYSEALACLPKTCSYVCYPRPAQPKPAERSRYGVGARQNLYGCPQSLFKLHPDFDALLGGILRSDPDGVALFIDNPQELRPHLAERWRETLGDVRERIRFVPPCSREGFIELLAASDVLLDPPHFSGGNSSLEALGVGTPIVTLPGAYSKSRLTLASYKRMDMMDCVAADERAYVQIAVRLGTDRMYRADIRRRIREASDVLFDDVGTVRALESFFSEAVARARRDGPLRTGAAIACKET